MKTSLQTIPEGYRIGGRRECARPMLAWCPHCDEFANMVTVGEASALAKVPSYVIHRWIEAGTVHYSDSLEGPVLICLNSIASKESEVVPEDTNPLTCPGNDGKYERLGRQAEVDWGIQTEAYPQRHNKEWGLNEGALNKLLALLDSDPERAGEKYEKIRRKLITFFECRGCASPADQADETIDRVTRRVDEGQPITAEDIPRYFYGVAR